MVLVVRGRILYFNKKIRFGLIILFLSILFNCGAFADEILQELDNLRSELSLIKDKNSPYYSKTKQKLDKLIKKNKLDYSSLARFQDVQRMIAEQKYNSAIYEIEALLEENYEVSKCYELLGDVYLKTDKAPKQIANFYKTSLKNNPDNYTVAYKLAKLYFREKKNIIASEYIRIVVEKTNECQILDEIILLLQEKVKPKDRYEVNILYDLLGEAYIKLGKKHESFKAYSKALLINSDDLYLKYHLAGLFYNEGLYSDALILVNSILDNYPHDFQIRILKAKIIALSGDFKNAYEEYLNVLNKYPNSNQARYGVYKIFEDKISFEENYKKVYLKKENYVVSIDDLKAFSVFLKKMEDEYSFEKISAYIANLEKIEKERQVAILRKKEQEELKRQEEKRLLQEKAQKEKEAKKEKLKKDTEKNQAKDKVSSKKEEVSKKHTGKKDNIEKRDNKIQKNITSQQTVKKQSEKKVVAFQDKKKISIDSKKYQELKNNAQKYLSQTPIVSQNYIAAANNYKLMGEFDTAIKYYSDAMKLEPTNSDVYYNLGLLYFELNDFENSKKNLVKSVNLDSENLKAKNLLTFVNQRCITHIINNAFDLYEKKEYIPAFEILDNGLKEYPNNAQIYYYRALVFCAMDRNAAAIIDLQKAIEFDPGYYMAYYELGKLYEKINDERSALVVYEKFLSVEPDEKDLVDEIQKKVISLGAKYY